VIELHDAYSSSELQTYETRPLQIRRRRTVHEEAIRHWPATARESSGGLLACGQFRRRAGLIQGVMMFWQLQHSVGKPYGMTTAGEERAAAA